MAHKQKVTETVPWWLKWSLALVVGVGSAVAATYTTFETQSGHDKDLRGVQEMLQEIRGDVKKLLGAPPYTPAPPEPEVLPPWLQRAPRPYRQNTIVA